MPEEYLRELARCQDSLPARPFVDIKNLVEAELGKPLHLIFHHVEETPIACASIAQVHRAKLTSGRDVVIKVQHAQVGERLLQDLKNLETIGETMKRLDPDFDFSPVCNILIHLCLRHFPCCLFTLFFFPLVPYYHSLQRCSQIYLLSLSSLFVIHCCRSFVNGQKKCPRNWISDRKLTTCKK